MDKPSKPSVRIIKILALPQRGIIKMNWMEFSVEIAKAIAWPVTALITLYILKEKVGELVPRLQKLKHKDTELEFAKAFSDIRNNRDVLEEKFIDLDTNLVEEKERILEFVVCAPKTAVQHSWNVMDRYIMQLIVKTDTIDKNTLLKARDVINLLKSLGVDGETLDGFKSLRITRRLSMIDPNYAYSKGEVESFVDLAIEIAGILKELQANKPSKLDALTGTLS